MSAPSSMLQQALTLHRQGKLAEAAGLYQEILRLNPANPDALHYFGLLLHQAGRNADAIQLVEQSLQLQPQNVEAWCNLGGIYHVAGQNEKALAALHRADAIDAKNPNVKYQLGTVLLESGEAEGAVAPLKKTLELTSRNFPPASANLGLALQKLGRLGEAARVLREAIQKQEGYADLHRNLAVTLEQMGEAEEAAEQHRKAVEAAPEDAESFSSLLHCLHNLPSVSRDEMLSLARKYGERFGQPAGKLQLSGRKPLTVGLVSSDLHQHPVAFFLESFLSAYDREKLRIICYANQNVEDATTESLRSHVSGWRNIYGMDAAQAAAMVREDGVDLLVDLGGHTGHNRLDVFAGRAAPVQASWLGYFNTTGLPHMDYVIADTTTVPKGDDRFYTETVIRLPHYFLCYQPPEDAGAVAPLPAEANGYVTFGSFNRLCKITPEVVACWSEILKKVEGSKLLLKAKGFGDESVADDFIARFAAHGIGSERLILEGPCPLADLYAAYGRIDIALDPFPHNGGTTTVQALWCGVPTIAVEGDRWVSRMGKGILTTAGLDEWVAKDKASYVSLAVEKASELSALAGLRSGLRAQVASSPLCDAEAFARDMEKLFDEMVSA